MVQVDNKRKYELSICRFGKFLLIDFQRYPIQSLLNSANLWIDPVRMRTRRVKSAYMRAGRVQVKKSDFYVKTLGGFGNF